jgi:cytochrome c peroxidase
VRKLFSCTAICIVLAGCGGGGSEGATGVNTMPAAMNPTPLPPTSYPAVAQFLDLDLAAPANYANPALPAHYDARAFADDNTPAGEPIDDRIATLGRVLFHDRRLSVNDTISCASCHRPEHGFSDPLRFSVGVAGTQFTAAHSMRLGNVRFFRPGSMFWDKRAATLELQATEPIRHPVEMGFDAANGGIEALLAKMGALAYYPELFSFAFGDPAVTVARIQRALAQFQRSMISSASRWDTAYAMVYDPAAPDRGLEREAPGLTEQENRGRALFILPPGRGGLGCAGCHVPPTFGLAANSLSNGLDAGETRNFKSPSLKNVALGGPYMHDGRFATLAEVVEHYDSGVKDGPALDNRLRGPGGPRVLNLSAADKAALVAFLRTLDDPQLGNDPRFSNPFRL